MSSFDSVEQYDVIVLAMRLLQEEMHTAMPGQVVAYDPTTQLADVQPMLKKPSFDDHDNRLTGVSFPVLPKVPVRWPQAGGFAFVLPMTKGDYVWIEFSEAGTGEFRNTGQESEPFDVGRHTITYPYCSPAAPPDTAAMTDSTVTGGSSLILGKLNTVHQIVISPSGIALGGPTPGDFVALASKCDANFTAIKTYLLGIFGTSPPATLMTTATGGPVTLVSATGPVPSMPSVASAEVACK